MANFDGKYSLDYSSGPGRTEVAMAHAFYIPQNLRDAGKELRHALHSNLGSMPKDEFIRAWASVAYLFPGLHPDGYEDMESGWPRVLRRLADEADRRREDELVSEEEFYQSDAQWCGIYDRLKERQPDEIERRMELASLP